VWAGESRRFGEGVAILVGDVAFVYADLLLPSGSPELAAQWHELRVELNIGQYLDLAGTATGGVDRAAARRIARLKSGRYTIQRPLQIGALLGDRPELAAALSQYGDPLGEAFQLRDDVLGVFGLEQRTGKPVGDDLREGKPTLMLAVAHERAEGAQRDLLRRVGDADLDDQGVADLQALFIETGALDVAEAEVAALAGRAVAALPAIPLPPHADLALRDLAAFVVARDA
jgi:geranylgeranyl diphosphate synthase type I